MTALIALAPGSLACSQVLSDATPGLADEAVSVESSKGWGAGGGQWGGGGSQWGGGGGLWGGGGSWWGGGGGQWAGGGGYWGGGGGLWGGGFANTFPFLGWSYSRNWNFRGIPQQGYNPTAPAAFSVARDTTSCPAGTVRLGGFEYPIDTENWQGFVALGYTKQLCIPTPGNGGLTMNPTTGDSALTKAGGYNLTGDLTNSPNDVLALKTMVGFGDANVATQYGGALCASIGSLAAAKRSCGVGIAFTDIDKNIDGSLSPRGVTMNAAQASSLGYRTPFGRNEGHSLYGVAANDMESYANHVFRKHLTKSVPATPSGIDAWNGANTGAFSFTATDFDTVGMTASPSPTKLQGDAQRSVGIVNGTNNLNMVAVDPSGVLASDMNSSLAPTVGNMYALSLHSMAAQQSMLLGGGGGRWFFHNQSDPQAANKPLMDLSSIFEGTSYLVTGALSGLPNTNPTLSNAYISPLNMKYADWRPDPAGTLYIDRAGQFPTTIGSDADKEQRLAAALAFDRPQPNIAGLRDATCAVADAGGTLKCWGGNTAGELGTGTSTMKLYADTVAGGMTSGVTSVAIATGGTCAVVNGVVKCWGYHYAVNYGLAQHTPYAVPGLPATTFTKVAMGDSHACAITSGGALWCWGWNGNGELGNGSQWGDGTPQQVYGMASGVTDVALSGHTSCALLSSGAMKCWGMNGNGQLGNGTTNDSYKPAQVSGLTSGVTAIAFGSDASHVCAITGGTTKQVKCWGWSMGGAVGNGVDDFNTQYTTPQLTKDSTGANLTGVSAIAAGNLRSYAIKNGQLLRWGQDDGQGADITRAAVHPSFTSGVASIATMNGYTVENPGSDTYGAVNGDTGSTTICAKMSDNTLKCSGGNKYGQLTNGTTVAMNTTAAYTIKTNATTNLANVCSATSSAYHVCAVVGTNCAAGGELRCWGRNTDGQLDLPSIDQNVPTVATALTGGVKSISGNADHACALMTNGGVKCWGNNSNGQLGNSDGAGHVSYTDQSVPTDVYGATSGYVQVVAGGDQSCGITNTGDVHCWGALRDSTIDTSSGENGEILANNHVVVSGAIDIGVGDRTACALLATGNVQCWGYGGNGERGDGTNAAYNTVTPVLGVSGATQLSTGSAGSCTLMKDGRVMCWGCALNNCPNTPQYVLEADGVTQLTGVVSISAEGGASCAVTQGGSVKCWGQNESGEVGDGTTNFQPNAVPVTALGTDKVSSVQTSASSTCARISGTGAVKCWGSNRFGQLGNGTNTDSLTAVATGVTGNTVNNNALIASQATVLINLFGTSSDPVSGHIMPMPFSMTKTTTGTQALMVTYDPLAVAAAEFIEQYSAHVAACNATTSESDVREDDGNVAPLNGQKQGRRLWACSNAADKASYLAGMQTFLSGARHYLFGRDDGCIANGSSCPTTLVDDTQSHYPYTLWVPDYTSTDTTYFTSLSNAVSAYRTAIIGSASTRLERTVQLAGVAKFTTNQALVTSRVTRSGAYGTDCIANDGFATYAKY